MKRAIAILSILFLAGCATTRLEETGSATGLGTDPFSTGGAFTAANANAMANAIDDNDDRLDTIEAITGLVFSDADGTYTDLSALSSTELLLLNGETDLVDVDDTPSNGDTADAISSNWAYDHVAAADPHTGYRLESADIDPDEISGDTSDDNFLDIAAGGTGGNTAETARTALEVYSKTETGSLLDAKQDDLDVPSDADIVTGTATDEAVWTIAKVVYAVQQHGQTTTRLRIDTTTTSDPTDEAVGDIFIFDNDTYDPCTITGTTPYLAICTATGSPGTYTALVDVAGNVLIAELATKAVIVSDADGINLTDDDVGKIIMMTGAGEVGMPDCDAGLVGGFVTIFVRDASEAVQVVMYGDTSNDYFILKDGTALDANDEADLPTTGNQQFTFMCTEANKWNVWAEDEEVTDGGAAD